MSVSTTYQKNSRIGSVYNVFTKTKKAELTTAEIAKKVGMDEGEARAKARHIAKVNGHLVKIDSVTFRLATDNELGSSEEHVPVARAANKPAPAYSAEELSESTAATLKTIAKAEGIKGYSSMKKDDLIDALVDSIPALADDGVRDLMLGKQGMDWFIANDEDDKTDADPSEILTIIELAFVESD